LIIFWYYKPDRGWHPADADGPVSFKDMRDGQEKENLKTLGLPIHLFDFLELLMPPKQRGQKPFYKKVSGLPKIFV
jgi:hypothetical protein